MKITTFKKILSKIEKKNIVIMGHMGSGKTSIGKAIAQAKGRKFIRISFKLLISKILK